MKNIQGHDPYPHNIIYSLVVLHRNMGRKKKTMTTAGQTYFDGYDYLSEKEKKVYDLLTKVNRRCVWGLIIEQVTTNGNACSFRSLVCQLKSEGCFAPIPMQKIIGVECWNEIIAL